MTCKSIIVHETGHIVICIKLYEYTSIIWQFSRKEGVTGIIERKFALFINEKNNISCDCSSEPSHSDGSNEGSQYMLSLRNKKNVFKLSSKPPTYLEL